MKAREAAYLILCDVEKGSFANLILDETLRKSDLSSLDRGLATEIVYGTVKYRFKLDWIIDQLVKKASKLETGPRIIIRMSLYQLLFLNKVPPSAVTNEAVKMAKKIFHTGIAGLVNGVLRSYLRYSDRIKWPDRENDPVGYLEVIYSHPRWMIERWLKRYDFEAVVKLCEFNNNPADLWIRTNTLCCTTEELMERLQEEGCTALRSKRVPEGILLKNAPTVQRIPCFREGLFTVQDESSMLAAHVLKPRPGQVVLDVCAGPGGKSTHLAQMMEDQGLIVACDVHGHRLGLIEETASRLGIHIIRTVLQDATKMEMEHEREYDLILVDAPCSGLGVLRRRADSRWRKAEEDIEKLAALQKNIIENAILVLKPGGRLVYSTCTIEPEENTEVIEKVKAAHPEIRGISLIPFLPYEPPKEEAAELEKGMRQYLPFVDGMEGFFIAVLEKLC